VTTTVSRKICMIGDFGVGKTSLVARFVSNTFSDRYLTTVGVKISTRELVSSGQALRLVLWDIAGNEEMNSVGLSYLRGAQGYLLVCDSTRAQTFNVAQRLQQTASKFLGDVPFLLLLNKSDLVSQREVDPRSVQNLSTAGWTAIETSAKTGEGVEAAFTVLLQRMQS
jgi:small GTP-binding protein